MISDLLKLFIETDVISVIKEAVDLVSVDSQKKRPTGGSGYRIGYSAQMK